MKKKKKIELEKTIWNFIDKHIYLIYFLLITVVAIVIRSLLIKYPSGDYDMFLKPWFNQLKSFGGLPGLGQDIGNYTPIYMTILSLLTYLKIDSLVSIKIISIIFDFVGAVFACKITYELLKNKEYRGKIALVIYGLYLILPTVLLNSAYWSQSDGIYTAFVLISIYYLIKNKFIKAIIFFAIAFAFKLQAIFVFPLYVLMYFNNRKLKFRYFLLIPVVIFVLSLPKALYSGNFLCGFDVYFNQAGSYSQYLTLNLPNIYSIFLLGSNNVNPNLIYSPLKEMNTIGVLVTLAIFVTIAFLVYKKKIKFDNDAIIDFALWSI